MHILDPVKSPSVYPGAAAILAALALTLGPTAAGAASPGRPDSRFGDHGVVARDFGTEGSDGSALAALAGPNGTTLVLQPGRAGVAVARYLRDGGLDPSFGDQGIALDPRTDAYLDEEGSLALGPGGEITASTPEAITRFTADGRLDTGYGEAGRALRGKLPISLSTSVTEPDGSTIALSDAFFRARGRSAILAYRFNPDGSLDRSYGANGRAFVPIFAHWRPSGLAVPQGGGLVIATLANLSYEHEEDLVLTRLDGNGRLDTSFGDGGSTVPVDLHGETSVAALYPSPFGTRTEMVEQPGGAIVVATANNVFVRYTPDGRLDPSFGVGGQARGPAARVRLTALTQTRDGGLLAAGTKQKGGEPNKFLAEKLTADGVSDPGFGAGGVVTGNPDPKLFHEAHAVLATDTGRVILAGDAVGDIELEALEADGAPAPDFGEDGLVRAHTLAASADTATGLVVDQNGATTVAGLVSGRPALARFSPNGGLQPSFGTDGTTLFPRVATGGVEEAAPTVAAGSRGSYLFGGGMGGPGGVFRVTHAGHLDRRFGRNGRAAASLFPALGIAVAPDGGIVAAGDAFFSGLVGLRADGRLNRSLGRGGKIPLKSPIPSAPGDEMGYAAPVAVGRDGTIAALTFRGTPAELDRSGRPLAAFDTRARAAEGRRRLPSGIVDLEFEGRKVLLFGTFNDGIAVTRLLADGRPDPGFGHDGLRTLRVGASLRPGRMALEPDGKIVVDGVSYTAKSGGAFEGASGRPVVARFDSDGSLDRSFASDGVFRGRRASVLRMKAIALGPGSVTAGGTGLDPGSADKKMFLLRLGR